MNEHIDEQLSALMDGELERDQTRFLLRRASTDTALPLRWERYHIARQTLRRQEVVVLRQGFADTVMARLESETTVHARGGGAWLRWGASGAIAASVAVAALVVTRPAPVPGEAPAVASARPAAGTLAGPTITAAPAAASSAPAVTALPDVRPPLLLPNTPADVSPVSFGGEGGQIVVLDPRLQSYLVRHYQSAGAGGASGFVPYVLLATPQNPEATQPGAAGAQNR
ncbi:MAG: sigma-E factor negative regulatory protein [Dokdonella sp.]|uniref:sigma-E factor negative regulatory protein n=1 Tax=Dokdonella sp. TaxID=2291710 RepID=UPI003F7DC77C